MAKASDVTADRSRDLGSISGELSDGDGAAKNSDVDLPRIERAVRGRSTSEFFEAPSPSERSPAMLARSRERSAVTSDAFAMEVRHTAPGGDGGQREAIHYTWSTYG